jgi:amidase
VSRPIRVAVVPAPPGGSVDPVVSGVVRRAADALANAGYDVVVACPPCYEEAVAVWARFIMGDFASVLAQLSPLMGPGGLAFLNAANDTVPPLADTAAMSQMLANRDGIARAWSQFLAAHPLILSPTWTQLPFEHGFDAASPEGAAATIAMIRPVVPANVLGLPSACVPAGRDEATGLPIGVLLTGQRLREDLCLDAAEAVEARLGLATPIDPVA